MQVTFVPVLVLVLLLLGSACSGERGRRAEGTAETAGATAADGGGASGETPAVGGDAQPAAEGVGALPGAPDQWPIGRFEALEPGLDLGIFPAGAPSRVGDALIRVLRIDPAHFEVRAVMASEVHPGWTYTAAGWALREGLVAAINTSMFATDHQTSVFQLDDADHVNNPDWHADASGLLLLDPVDPGLPVAQLLDVRCDDAPALRDRYRSHVQGYRMLTCDGQPAWSDRPREWSHAVIGQDRQGRILFIHARSPWSTHSFTRLLLGLPLEVTRLQYAEGGPEATLFIGAGGREFEWVGSYETGFYESDDNHRAWPLPNVLGVVPRVD